MKNKSLPKTRRHVSALILALTLFSSLALARSAVAVPFLYTLTGVTFDDGAAATGSFIFDPNAGTYGAFDIKTSDGLVFSGSHYSPGAGTGTDFLASPDAYIFDNFGVDSHYLNFSYSGHITAPGVYALEIGSPNGPGSFSNSGEFVNSSLDYRLLTTGSLTVTSTSSVPDTGGTLLSLTLGIAAVAGFQRCNRRLRASSAR